MKHHLLFHLGTEFHYLLALLIEQQHFSDAVGRTYLINRVDGRVPARLVQIVASEPQIHYLDLKSDGSTLNVDLDEQVARFSRLPNVQFITFLNQDPLSILLNEAFREHGLPTALAPDGIAAYTSHRLPFTRTNFKVTQRFWYFLKANGLSWRKLRWVTIAYAANSHYDFIFDFGLPPQAENAALRGRKSIRLNTAALARVAAGLDNTSSSYETLPKENVVLIVGQNYQGSVRLDRKVIEVIREVRPQAKIVYKVHPNALKARKGAGLEDRLLLGDNVIVVTEKFPVELYINELKEGVVLSAFSTSSVFHNPGCRYGWYFPWDAAGTTKNHKFLFHRPVDHIELIEDAEALKSLLLHS